MCDALASGLSASVRGLGFGVGISIAGASVRGLGFGVGIPGAGLLGLIVGKTILVKFQAHIVFCFCIFGVFGYFSGADFIFYDFVFSVSRHLWRRKM